MHTRDGRIAAGVAAMTVLVIAGVIVASALGLIPHDPRPSLDVLQAENVAIFVFAVALLGCVGMLLRNIPRGVDPYPAITLMVVATFTSAAAMALTWLWMGDCHCLARLVIDVLAAVDAVLTCLALCVGSFLRPNAMVGAIAQMAFRQADKQPTSDPGRAGLYEAARRLEALADRHARGRA